MQGGDVTADDQQRKFFEGCLYKSGTGLEQVQKFYDDAMTTLLKQQSRKILGTYTVDVIRE
jgi:hypothetical protein